MDPPYSLHKSTISPSGSDLCPVRDACNWGRAVAALLGGVCDCARIYIYILCVYACMHWAKCWRVSPVRAVTPADKSWVTSRCCTFFPTLSSSSCFPPVSPPAPFTPPSSPERFHYPLKGLNGVCRAEYKAGREKWEKALRDLRCLS